MTDEAKALVERLRVWRKSEFGQSPPGYMFEEAADRIEALSAENDRLNAMLTAATYEAKAMMNEIKRLGGGMRVSLEDLP